MNRRRDHDQGVVLPIVLLVTVVLAAMVIAIAQFGATNLRYGRIVEERSDRLSAADAAMRYAVDQLKVGAAACLYDDVPVGLPALASQFNGATGSVTCEVISGGLDDIRAWAIAVTGEGLAPSAALLSTQGGSIPKILNGPVWMSRVDSAALDLSTNAGIEIQNGPLVHYGGPSPCVNVTKASLGPDVNFEPDLIFGPLCVSNRWYEQEAFREPPIGVDLDNTAQMPLRDGASALTGTPRWGSIGSDTVLGAYELVGTCRVYYPGRYLTPPVLNNTHAYFVTGDYYFDFRNPATVAPTNVNDYTSFPIASAANAGFTVIRSEVTAGRVDPDPDLGVTRELPNPDCPETVDPSPAGYGATFYMGGRSHVRISNQGSFEIMPRLQGGTEYVAIHAVCDWTINTNNQASWCVHSDDAFASVASASPSLLRAPGDNSAPTSNPSIVYTEPGNNREMIANGLIYAPLADMEFGNVTNSAVQKMRGGLVIGRAKLQSSTSATNFEIGSGGSPIDTGLRLIATGAKNGLETKIVAVVEYDGGLGVPYDEKIAVNSWRVCEIGGC